MKKLLFLMLAFTVAAACTEEEAPYLDFGGAQDSTITLPANDAYEAISFTTNHPWTASSSAAWLAVSPISGDAGAHSIWIMATDNTDYDPRTAVVTIQSQGISQPFNVIQAENTTFTLSATDFEIGSDGGSIKIPVSANVEYSVSVAKDSESWLSVTHTKGLNNYMIELSVKKNDTYDERIGTVKVSAEGKSSSITITQSQLDEVIVGTTEFEIGSGGGEIKVPVSANVDFTCEVMNNVKDWITADKIQTKGLGEYYLVLNVARNDGYDGRIGQIKVAGAGKESVITISQSQLDEVVVGSTEFEIGVDGGNIEVPVASNVQYSAEVLGDSDWLRITDVQTKGLEEYSLKIFVEKNTGYDDRTGQVKVSGAGKESIVTVTQSQLDGLVLEATEYKIGNKGGDITIPVLANIGYSVEIEGGISWLSVMPEAKTKGLDSSRIRLHADENTLYEDRTAMVKILGNGIEKQVNVIQSRQGVITLSQNKFEFETAGGTFDVEVTSNVEYEVEIDSDWVQLNRTKVLVTGTCSFAVSPLTDPVRERTAVITFKAYDGETSAELIITQANPFYMDRSFLTLQEEDTYSLQLVNLTGRKVVWSSSDTSVAKVDRNGVVTALSRGAAEITASTEDGKYSATIAVNVKSLPEYISAYIPSSAVTSVNGYISGSVSVMLSNKSNRDVEITKLEMIPGDNKDTVYGVNIQPSTIAAGTAGGYSVTIRLSIYKPIFRYTYTCDGKEYTAETLSSYWNRL